VTDEHHERLRSLKKLHAKRRTPRYRSLLAHWAARALIPPSRAKVAPLPRPKAGQVAISYAGHATALIHYRDLAVLCDPHLGDWCGAVHREVRAGLSPGELGDVDLILLSGQGADHLDPKTLSRLPRSATVIVPPYSARHVSSFGFARVMELAAGQSVEHRGVDISAVSMQAGRDKSPVLGYTLRGDGPSAFFCGSSGYFDGFAKVGSQFAPDIALLPIGGFAPFRQENMSPLDAIYAFEDLCAKIMIPIRYGSFALSYEKLHVPARWLAELVAARDLEENVVAMEPGQSRVFVRPSTTAARPEQGAQHAAQPKVRPGLPEESNSSDSRGAT
jgi:L-ascorbate metabolism protein UlaG (beta-lactamase superfamily)